MFQTIFGPALGCLIALSIWKATEERFWLAYIYWLVAAGVAHFLDRLPLWKFVLLCGAAGALVGVCQYLFSRARKAHAS